MESHRPINYAHLRILVLLVTCLIGLNLTALSQPRKPGRAPASTLKTAKSKSSSEQGRLYPVSRRWPGRNHFGFIDGTGKLVIDFEKLPKTTKYVGEFHEGLAVIFLEYARTNETTVMGYIDRTGKIVIKPRFTYARDFSEGLAYVESKEFHGFIDKTGKTVINLEGLTSAFGMPIEELGAKDFHEGRAAVGTGRWPGYTHSFRDDANNWNARWGYIDRAGRLVVKPLYNYADNFSEGLAGIVVDSRGNMDTLRYGFIDKDGRMVIRPQFVPRRGGPHLFGLGGTSTFHEGLACVVVRNNLGDLYGYIDREGSFVIQAKFARATDFSDGVAWAVSLDFEKKVFSTIGFIDKAGSWVLTEYKGQKFPHYLTLEFSEGLAAVPSHDSLGNYSGMAYMDHKGMEVIKPLRLTTARTFESGIAFVDFYDELSGAMFGYINRRGKFIWRSR